MSIAILASGTLLKIGNAASSEAFTTIPECKKIKAPNVKYDLKDTTSHDNSSGFRTYLPGLADGENVTAELNFVPTNTYHTLIRTNGYAKLLTDFQLLFAGGGTGANIAFSAYIIGFPAEADIGEILMNTMTAKVTGAPTWT